MMRFLALWVIVGVAMPAWARGDLPEVQSKSAVVIDAVTGAEIFGKDADEFFHAWHVACYINQVAAAGKAEYALPMYVNAALRDPDTRSTLAQTGVIASPGSPAEFAAYLRDEIARWGKVIREKGVKGE